MAKNPDLEDFRAKYATERAKRVVRVQDPTADGESAAPTWDEDPFTPFKEREPIRDSVDVLIVGGGFAGISLGVELRKQGMRSLRYLDRAGDFGGTWYWNKYPGAQCDIESYIYLPFLEEMGYVPTLKYCYQPEILSYAKSICSRYDLYRDAFFHTEVTSLEWQEGAQRWQVSTDRGDLFEARWVCMANGPLQKAKLPAIPGVDRFRGHWFHTSRWDYAYTKGNEGGDLEGLADKTVGIIGTGATAVQCIPHLARSAKRLLVFQRTPSTIAPRRNRETDPEWAASLLPGWQKERMDNFLEMFSGIAVPEDLVNDGWTEAYRRISANSAFAALAIEERRERSEVADLELMQEIRGRIEETIDDPGIREGLKPYYRYFCKRPCFHDDYLPTFNRENVQLIDTQGLGVGEITENGLVVEGVEYPVDCLVFATGFEVSSAYTRRAGYEVVGRNGVSLSKKWRDGMRSLHGIMTSGFPNLFFSPTLNAQYAIFGGNFVHALVEFAEHVGYILGRVSQEGGTFDVDEQAEEEWVQLIVERSFRSDPNTVQNVEFLKTCTPGYLNNEGHPEKWPAANVAYGGPAPEFYALLDKWRSDGSMSGLNLSANSRPDD